jgi:hypothetical protein
MILTILTIISIFYLYRLIMKFFTDKLSKKFNKNAVIRFTRILGLISKLPGDKLKIMELNDRYVIDSDIESMSVLGTAKLFKGEKKLFLSERYFELTDKEYNDILEVIKPKL